MRRSECRRWKKHWTICFWRWVWMIGTTTILRTSSLSTRNTKAMNDVGMGSESNWIRWAFWLHRLLTFQTDILCAIVNILWKCKMFTVHLVIISDFRHNITAMLQGINAMFFFTLKNISLKFKITNCIIFIMPTRHFKITSKNILNHNLTSRYKWYFCKISKRTSQRT